MLRFLLTACLLCSAAFAEDKTYDPLTVADGEIASKTFSVHDDKRNRDLPLRVYLPETSKPAAVILFSHGLGGSRDNNPYLGNYWAKRGYLVVFMQHPGSDESVWKNIPPAQRIASMKAAASLENFLARTKDAPAVLDALKLWNDDKDHPLHGKMNLEHIGMSGHSFGARTTQAVIGQSFPGESKPRPDPRIDAAVIMSPSPPLIGDPEAACRAIEIPCLLMTGTRDESPIGGTTAADRLKVFPYLQKAPAWQVVFNQGTHMIFGDRAASEEPRYHRAILALTTAFWDANLKSDAAAREWLTGPKAKSVLMEKDVWELSPGVKK